MEFIIKESLQRGTKRYKKLASTSSPRDNLISTIFSFSSLDRELQMWLRNLAPVVLQEHPLNFSLLPSYNHLMIITLTWCLQFFPNYRISLQKAPTLSLRFLKDLLFCSHNIHPSCTQIYQTFMYFPSLKSHPKGTNP